METAREQVASLIGAHPLEIIFTSCATESNNAAIHAALKANPDKRHIVTSAARRVPGRSGKSAGKQRGLLNQATSNLCLRCQAKCVLSGQ
ncbi:MAG: aminotransferase class V-fold PLP-dependent enzyme [Burkholderiales bacterium]